MDFASLAGMISQSVVLAAVLLAAVNVAAWVLLRSWPGLLRSENERLNGEYLARFDGPLRKYVPEWFDIAEGDWAEFRREYSKGETGSHKYQAFVEFSHPVFAGRFINFDAAGFRHGRDQAPWPPDPSAYNIFFFGGSTALNVGPDWTCIPSYMQELLREARPGGKPVRLYNFGRGSYFSTQERILFQQLLLDGTRPDMAVFFDGVNDCYFFNGLPATHGIYAQALDEHNRTAFEQLRLGRLARPKWARLSEFLRSLPLSLLIERLGRFVALRNATAEQAPYRPIPIEDALIEQALDRWLGNKKQIEAVAAAHGVATFFVWQPTPAYKYDLSHHVALNPQYGLGGHERSGRGCELLAQRIALAPLGPDFLWLAAIQEQENRPLYLDSMHYVSDFNRVIATHIVQALVARGILKG